MIRSRNLLRGILMLAVGLAATAHADTSVWSVTSGDNVVYLGGTVHVLRSSDYPLPEEYEQAYLAASEIYFETDMTSMMDMSTQVQMMEQLTYSDGRSLKTVLNDDAYTALSQYTESIGMPLVMIGSFKPGLLVTTLQITELQRMGFTLRGVDVYFTDRAIGDAKSLGQLETVEEQIGFLSAMGEGYESEFVLLSLRELEQTGQLMAEMLKAWREGDREGLSRLFIEPMKLEVPQLYDSLLLQRNLKWVPQIDQMLSDGDTEFVLVGAAHLVGEHGLLKMLADKGYKIRQL